MAGRPACLLLVGASNWQDGVCWWRVSGQSTCSKCFLAPTVRDRCIEVAIEMLPQNCPTFSSLTVSYSLLPLRLILRLGLGRPYGPGGGQTPASQGLGLEGAVGVLETVQTFGFLVAVTDRASRATGAPAGSGRTRPECHLHSPQFSALQLGQL